MNREQAYNLMNSMVQNPNLKKHCLAVEAIMRALAKELQKRYPEIDAKEFNEEEWGVVGLLHDADYELTNKDLEKHTEVIVETLKKMGVGERVINGILAHHPDKKPNRENFLEKAVFCADELSGLITAVALVRPDKKLTSVTVESVLKKFPEKSFAAGVHREHILRCESELGLSLEEFVKIALQAMQGIADQLGL